MELKKPEHSRHWVRILQLLFIPTLISAGFILLHLGYDWRLAVQNHGASGYALYFAFVCLLPLIGFPISAFYIFSGIAFPPLHGLLLTSGGLAINMTLGYGIGRLFLHRPANEYLKKTRFNPELITSKNLTRLTILIRSVPGVPYFMQNYLLAVWKVPFRTYIAISWMVQSLYCAGTIYLTYSGMNLKNPADAGIFIIIGMLFIGSIWYSRKKLTQSHASDVDSKRS